MIEIVIKIEEETYNRIMNGWMPLHKAVNLMENVQKGTPLPKGHGRLIDADDIRVIELEDSLHIIRHEKGDGIDVYIDAPTIIEAEKGDSE